MASNNLHPAKDLYVELRDVMSREIGVMRELLSNIETEQQALLVNSTDKVKQTLRLRDPMMDELLKQRHSRIELLKKIVDDEVPEQERFSHLAKESDVNISEIIALRDQMITLIDRIKSLSSTNNYLIQNKVAFTKELIRRVHPKEAHPLYTKQGTTLSKKRAATQTLINREV